MSEVHDKKDENKEKDGIETKEEVQETDLSKALADYKSDMFKYKEGMKAAKTELAQLKADKAAVERTNLEKNEEWKLLYEKERDEKAEALADLADKSTKFIDSSKINAVLQKVGGFKKDSYAKFIEADKVEMNENGTIDTVSLMKEVDRIKQNYPELLDASQTVKMPDGAPKHIKSNDGTDLSQMSKEELKRAYSAQKK